MFAGMMGALFSALPSVAAIPDKTMVFNPVREQAVLKIAVGAWSAVFGLFAITAGLVQESMDQTAGTPSTNVQTFAGFVMTCALFGAAQEALTRFADRKATVVRDQVTS